MYRVSEVRSTPKVDAVFQIFHAYCKQLYDLDTGRGIVHVCGCGCGFRAASGKKLPTQREISQYIVW